MQRKANTVRAVAALVLGLTLTACMSGGDHNSSPVGQVGSALNGACTPTSPCSVWATTATPAGSDNTTSVELGVKVQSSQSGFITGVRFYKDDTNNPTHTVNLWDRSGTLLATATSTSESTSGWQTVSFAQAVAVSANTTYVASYLMPGGAFALDRPGFTSAVVNAPLQALADGQDGPNGVFAYGNTSSFPSTSVGASNYWVDVLFSTTAPSAADGGAADGSATTDGGPNAFQQYSTQYANAICTAFATCCGATFDVAGCKANLSVQGYDNTLPTIPASYTSGHLTIDQTQAAACIAALNAWPCGATITSAQNQAILSACHGVLAGTIPIGGTGCSSSFECVSGAYCGASDAGGNQCIALAGSGGPCTQGESPDHQCTYIGTAQPALYCNIYPSDGGASSGSGTCQPVQTNGARCSDGTNFYSDYACTGQLCDFGNTATCVASGTNPADPALGFECSNFVLVDAGGGG